MTYHTRTPITNKIAFEAFTNDRRTQGEAFMRYENRDICFDYDRDMSCGMNKITLTVMDVSNAFKAGKNCKGFWIEARCKDAVKRLHALFTLINYDISVFFDCCYALDIDYEANVQKFVDKEHSIAITPIETKGVETFSPLALTHLKPLKEIPKKWTISHVRRLLAAKQYSYCGVKELLTCDYVYDAANNFSQGQASGEAFLKELTEDATSWRISHASDHHSDGDSLIVSCYSFEKRMINIDLLSHAAHS